MPGIHFSVLPRLRGCRGDLLPPASVTRRCGVQRTQHHRVQWIPLSLSTGYGCRFSSLGQALRVLPLSSPLPHSVDSSSPSLSPQHHSAHTKTKTCMLCSTPHMRLKRQSTQVARFADRVFARLQHTCDTELPAFAEIVPDAQTPSMPCSSLSCIPAIASPVDATGEKGAFLRCVQDSFRRAGRSAIVSRASVRFVAAAPTLAPRGSADYCSPLPAVGVGAAAEQSAGLHWQR